MRNKITRERTIRTNTQREREREREREEALGYNQYRLQNV